jgi:two-component system cell cycle sensor histidine kinase/response regulator CckA
MSDILPYVLTALNGVCDCRVALMIPDNYEHCFELLPDALLIHAGGACVYANAAARELFGDVTGRALESLLPDGELDVAAREARMLRADGGGFDAEIRTRAAQLPSGDAAVLMSVRELGERARGWREAEQTRRADSLARVANSIAHEFNNVLMGAGTFATVLSRKLGNEDVGVQGMRSALERGRQVTAEIARYARGVEVQLHDVPVEEWLRGVVDAAAERVSPSTLRLRFDDAPVTACIDRVQLGEALTALLLRARDAMPTGGVIDVVAQRAGHALGIRVIDHGAPLSPETCDVAFEPSFSTKKSAALALAVAQQIVLRHGGRVAISSEGGLTTVTIAVPTSSGVSAED